MKQLTFNLLFSLLLFSCSNQSPQHMESSTNEKLVRQYFAYFNLHQWQQLSDLYSKTAEFKDPSLGPGIVKQSRHQIFEKYSKLNEVYPDIKDTIVNVYPSGDKNIIVEFISTGTAPDHSKFELPICTIFTIENGLITKDFTYFDNFEEE